MNPFPDADQVLVELLTALFGSAELRTFVLDGPDGIDIDRRIPEDGIGVEDRARRSVGLLRQRGRVDQGFFARLRTRRAGHIDAIATVEAAWCPAPVPAVDEPIELPCDLFLAYATADRPSALHLLGQLRRDAPELRIFLDCVSVRAGTPLGRFAEVLERASVMAILVSHHMRYAPYVAEELRLARDRTQRDARFAIVPMFLDDDRNLLPDAQHWVGYRLNARSLLTASTELVSLARKLGASP